jgi:hypothetical protein
MSTKTITITEEAYYRLKSRKAEDQSFSEVLFRISLPNGNFQRSWTRLVKTTLWRTELRQHPNKCGNPKFEMLNLMS